MDRLLAKGDYFKSTTRVVLTELEKLETIKAIDRACEHLGRLSSTSRIEFTTMGNGREIMRNIQNSQVYFSRWVNLVKGSTQPRHLYRRRRRFDVEIEAQKVANETGADYGEVRSLLMQLMDKYIGEHP